MRSRNCFFVVVLALFIFDTSPLFSLEDYGTKYLKNEPFDDIQLRLAKEIARKRFSLDHSANYYYVMGNKYRDQGELRLAVKNYEYAIFLDPKSSGDCYRALAEIYYFLGEFAQSVTYLNIALEYPFSYLFDKMKALYLLVTDYFRLKKDDHAIAILKEITAEYQEALDRQVINGLNIKYEYYAPAFFILSLYYRNHGELNDPTILQKASLLGFKKAYVNYFLYEFYQTRNQPSIALEYLRRAKEIQPNIEEDLKTKSWMHTYDLYSEIITR